MTSRPLLSRRTRRHLRRRVGGALLCFLGPPLVRALSWTWRVELVGQEIWARFTDDDSPTRGCMTALWHGRMLLGVDFGRARKFAVLVSPSADGDISERMLAAFGYRVVRGSSNRGGVRAVRAMLEELRAGSVVALTPDGPRGPRHVVNPGLAWMSRATGYPVVPLGLTADRAWHLSSWDAFTIPKPFARVTLVFGEPVQVARGATQAELEAASESIRERLLDCERRGFARLGRSVDW